MFCYDASVRMQNSFEEFCKEAAVPQHGLDQWTKNLRPNLTYSYDNFKLIIEKQLGKHFYLCTSDTTTSVRCCFSRSLILDSHGGLLGIGRQSAKKALLLFSMF